MLERGDKTSNALSPTETLTCPTSIVIFPISVLTLPVSRLTGPPPTVAVALVEGRVTVGTVGTVVVVSASDSCLTRRWKNPELVVAACVAVVEDTVEVGVAVELLIELPGF